MARTECRLSNSEAAVNKSFSFVSSSSESESEFDLRHGDVPGSPITGVSGDAETATRFHWESN